MPGHKQPTKKSGHRYRLLYSFEDVDLSVEDAQAKVTANPGGGACDAVFVASLLYPEDGSFSCLFLSRDGRSPGKQLDDNEWFKIWSMLASRLAQSKTLHPNKKELCALTFECVATAVRKPKDN